MVDESALGVPTGPAAALVAAYQGYRQRGLRPAEHLGLASPYLTVIFSLDEPIHLARHVDPSATPGDYQSLVGGLHTSPALVTHDGSQSGVQLLVHPLAARRLFGLPAGELAHHDGEAAEVIGPVGVEIQERLQCAAGWPERWAVLDDAVAGLVGRHRPGVPAPVARAWQLLVNSGGRVPVGAVAAEVGYSTRQLASLFAREVGLSPKVAARVIRFDRARRDLQRRAVVPEKGSLGLADLAARHGFSDQSHLVREWSVFTGLAPTTWVAGEL